MMAKFSCIIIRASSLLIAAAALTAKAAKIKRETIPEYVLTYAPYSYLYSGETWWPSDVATHLMHVTPEVNYVAVEKNVTLETLNELATDVYLTSNDNVEDNPAWLLSTDNKPESCGYSSAPATIIIVEKDGGILDAFYFYFYSYNHGNKVLGEVYGNHVGDWEHSMVRFVNEVPTYIYLSEHSSGSAYTYDALNQTDSRATTYIATGTHANYATAGKQDYEGEILGIFLSDETDQGPYWDVTQNYRGFFYDNSTGVFTSAGGASTGGTEQTTEGVNWLYWLGMWGDEQYPSNDSRQYCIDTECHYSSGPTGPLAKNLGRTTVCQSTGTCTIKTSI